jgi:hypothetical protein
MRRLVLALLASIVFPHSALAYRPFDSTDAAVAEKGEFEVELSPLGFRHGNDGPAWISPAARLNYGFAQDWEAVLEGQAEHPEHGRSELVENALSLKTVLKEGSLQDKPGLSIGTEGAILFPGSGQPGAGVSLAALASQRWSWGALHVNLAGSRTRDGHGGLFFGSILEGPGDWPVRPAIEFVYEREFGALEEVSLLAGLIWQVSDKFALDFGLRQARINSRPETEIRTGLTFAFSALD